MARTADAMDVLATVLTEWRDAGGSVDEVVMRIMDLADARIEASRNQQPTGRTEHDWERLLEANHHMSDELAGFRLLPCQCPKCGHEHTANVRPHVPVKLGAAVDPLTAALFLFEDLPDGRVKCGACGQIVADLKEYAAHALTHRTSSSPNPEAT